MWDFDSPGHRKHTNATNRSCDSGLAYLRSQVSHGPDSRNPRTHHGSLTPSTVAGVYFQPLGISWVSPFMDCVGVACSPSDGVIFLSSAMAASRAVSVS